ncbi:hypothetical protein WMY93_006909 [Mugilogobius chulae]|uniref:snRNA-activating protein complex subunit 3 n=1 Tax=Mugilogobius chulae TaxID=88201 RepID=A0AAW0PVG5_9GOBI
MAACDSKTNIPEYERTNINSKPFHVDSFRTQWLKRLHPSHYSYEQPDQDEFDANFAKEMGIDEDTMSDLKSICRQRKKKQDQKLSLKCNKNRHEHYADELERVTSERKPEAVENLIPQGDVLLTINIYYPAVFDRFNYTRPHMTFLLTGSHTLAELRDAICCVSDLQVSGEFSNNPDMVPDFVSKDHYKSAFFYFEGVFYDDMRFPECRDLSATTIEWAKTRNFPLFTQGKMENTRFVDLKVKVGYPYLYCHQGDCEHLVIITDIRLMHRNDCLDKKNYPLLIHKDRIDTHKCAVCHVYIGRWYTTNDQFAPSDPCLFCDKCFRMLHYDTEGNKLGHFLAYPYIDRGAFN